MNTQSDGFIEDKYPFDYYAIKVKDSKISFKLIINVEEQKEQRRICLENKKIKRALQ